MIQDIITILLTAIVTVVVSTLWKLILERIKKPKWQTYFEAQQLHNLRQEISLYYADKRANKRMNSTEKQWLVESYDTYTKLGGNSWVTSLYEEMINTWETID